MSHQKQVSIGDTVRLIDRSYSLAVVWDGETDGPSIAPGYPLKQFRCLDKCKEEGSKPEWCEYKVIGTDLKVVGLSLGQFKDPDSGYRLREDQAVCDLAIENKGTGDVLFTSSRFVQVKTPVTVMAFDDSIIGLSAAERRAAGYTA